MISFVKKNSDPKRTLKTETIRKGCVKRNHRPTRKIRSYINSKKWDSKNETSSDKDNKKNSN